MAFRSGLPFQRNLPMARAVAAWLALVLLASCGQAPTLLPSPAPSATASVTPQPPSSPTPTVTETPTPTATPRPAGLAVLADAIGLELGVEMNPDLYRTNPASVEILLKDFNAVTIDQGLYGFGTTDNPNAPFDFSIVDLQVAYALSQGLRIRGHPLFYPTLPPQPGRWTPEGNVSSAALRQIITHHVAEVVGHYKGEVKEWVVVNEAIQPGHMDYPFFHILGYNYIVLAFAAARQADPGAVLLYNDSNDETSHGSNTAATRQIVAWLKSKGLIDGVGLQMHLNGDNPPLKADVIATMRSYGVPVYVTEFDVNLGQVGGDQSQRFAVQAEIYRSMLQACLESGVCKGFTLWGIGDKYSWIETRQDAVPNADPTLFDDQLQPKPAYFAVRSVLQAWEQMSSPTP